MTNIKEKQKNEVNNIKIPLKVLYDKNLSLKAKGIFSYLMMVRDDGYETDISKLYNSHSDGSNSIQSGLKELENSKYIKKKLIRDEKGQFQKHKIAINVSKIYPKAKIKNDIKTTHNKIINKKTKKILREINNQHGLYKIYNQKKKLIYIGKSKCLGKRIPQSIKDKSGYYFSCTITKNYLDASMYEAYYIGKEKPPLNIEYKQSRNSNINLSDLCFSELFPYYQEVI